MEGTREKGDLAVGLSDSTPQLREPVRSFVAVNDQIVQEDMAMAKRRELTQLYTEKIPQCCETTSQTACYLPTFSSHSLNLAYHGFETYLEPSSPPQAMQPLSLHPGALMEPLGLCVTSNIVDGAIDFQAS